jgi:hypothetical protein
MKLTPKEGRMVIGGDHEDWETVETECIEQQRWSVIYSGVFKHIPSDKYYNICWSTGATEQQDEQPFEYDAPELIEVRPVEKVVIAWEKV